MVPPLPVCSFCYVSDGLGVVCCNGVCVGLRLRMSRMEMTKVKNAVIIIIVNSLPGTVVGLHRMALQPLPFAIGIESCPELNRGGRQHTLE